MSFSRITVGISGDARANFDEQIHDLFENDKLTIVSRSTNVIDGDAQIVLVIVGRVKWDLSSLVIKAIDSTNRLYPDTAFILLREYA